MLLDVNMPRFDELPSCALKVERRSRYVHTGCSFGGWLAPRRDGLEEVRYGRPILEDEALADLLQDAPTYVGLERIIRYWLIRFAERHEFFIDVPA
jgi:hypothetical protein